MFLKHLLLLLVGLTVGCVGRNSTPSVAVNSSKSDISSMEKNSSQTPPNKAIATLGGGCFWCVEAVFSELQGVEKVISGYSGGAIENPTYRQVCSGNSGHIEVVQVIFDANVISYEDILTVFFHVHDPTTLNRQGNDVGEQYKSVIFYQDEAQKASAEKVIQEIGASGLWKNPIVTEVTKLKQFYPAEDYHQSYYKENQNQGYCVFVISPKMKKFREQFKDKLKK
jgi:peptide-methionine (S)-S-oxide reductase